MEGVEKLLARRSASRRDRTVLCANAGRGLGRAFVDQEWADIRRVIATNVFGTTYLLHKAAKAMKAQGKGRDPGHRLHRRVDAGHVSGGLQRRPRRMIDSLSEALRAELKDTDVTITCLMPGATETEFFQRADMMDTKVGTAKKDDAAMVAKTGWDAMMDDTRQRGRRLEEQDPGRR